VAIKHNLFRVSDALLKQTFDGQQLHHLLMREWHQNAQHRSHTRYWRWSNMPPQHRHKSIAYLEIEDGLKKQVGLLCVRLESHTSEESNLQVGYLQLRHAEAEMDAHFRKSCVLGEVRRHSGLSHQRSRRGGAIELVARKANCMKQAIKGHFSCLVLREWAIMVWRWGVSASHSG
jgi:hypothetical protein